MTTPFVGRAGELAALTADLDAAVGGHQHHPAVAVDCGVQIGGQRGQLARTAHKRSRHPTASPANHC